MDRAKIYYADGGNTPCNIYLKVGEITRKEAEEISNEKTSNRVDEMLLDKFGSLLYNNNLMVEQFGKEYFLKVHSNLEPEHKE